MSHNAAITGLLVALERDYPAYQCWLVPVYQGPNIWAARPWGGDYTQVLNADSEPHLREALETITTEGEQ